MRSRPKLPSLPGSRALYLALGGLALLEAAAILAQMVFLARAITFLFEGRPLPAASAPAALFLGAYAARYVLGEWQHFLAERFAERTAMSLRKRLMEAAFRLGPRFIQTQGTGRVVTLAMEGMEHVKAYLELAIPRIIRTAIVPVAIVIYVWTLDWSSAVILIFAVPLLVVFMILLGLAAQKQADKQYDTYRVLSNHFVDTLRGLETLAYLGRSRHHEQAVSTVSRKYRQATVRTLRIAFLSSFALDFFTSLSIAFVAVGLGFRLIDGAIGLLPALTILLLSPEYFLPIRQVGADYHATLDGQVAMQQAELILKRHEDIPAPDARSRIKWHSSNRSLTLHKVTVCHHQADKPALSDLHFSWQGGGLIVLAGASGAGKSTLIDVLAGFIRPTDGHIIVNGQACASLDRSDWQEQMAYIPQHPYIFPMSLADNIRFYEPRASDSAVAKVIDLIGLQSFVRKLPRGMHEPIGEQGRPLSGGQAQRVAMARALLSERPILLLDEPTAHLDIETEYEIKQVMLRLFAGKLVFLATHRLHWLQHADHILFLENGRIKESGTFAALSAKRAHLHKFLTSRAEEWA